MKLLLDVADFDCNRSLRKSAKKDAQSARLGARPGVASGCTDRFGQLSSVAPPCPPINVEEKVGEARAARVRFSTSSLHGGSGGDSKFRYLRNGPILEIRIRAQIELSENVI